MRKNMNRILATVAAIFMGVFFMTAESQAQDPENTLYLDLKDGRVVIELLPDLAPKHVARIKELTREGFYNGLVFHRVIDGFMAQGGDPEGSGMGGSGQNLPAEFSSEPFARGVLGMARSQEKSTRLNSSHITISYAVFCLKKKKRLHTFLCINMSTQTTRRQTRP